MHRDIYHRKIVSKISTNDQVCPAMPRLAYSCQGVTLVSLETVYSH